jgi:hypothetical protein
MILELPLSNDPAQTFTTQLGPKKYVIEVKYNDRSGVWTMDLADEVTTLPLLESIPLVLGTDLLGAYNFGIGSIIVVDTSNRSQDVGATDLGTRVRVYWISPEEVAP